MPRLQLVRRAVISLVILVPVVSALTGLIGAQTLIPPPITVQNSPYGVAVNQATNKIYVSNTGSDSISVIDGATNGVTNVPLGVANTFVVNIALNPVTNRLYTANSGLGTVTVLNTANNPPTVVTTLTAGNSNSDPEGVAVNPTTNRIFVATASGQYVRVFDGTTNAQVGNDIPMGGSAMAIAVNPVTNKAYIAVQNLSQVKVINGANLNQAPVVIQLPTNPNSAPRDITINTVTNRIYTANQNGQSVSVIDGVTDTLLNVQGLVNPIPVPSDPRGVAINENTNRLYVGRSTGNAVAFVDAATHQVLTNVTTGATTQAIRGVGVNPATDRVYAAANFVNQVAVIQDVNPPATATAIAAQTATAVAANSTATAAAQLTATALAANATATAAAALTATASVPTATRTPTATATATPTTGGPSPTPGPPTCNPRPPVGVAVTTAGAGRIQATISATTNQGGGPNALVSLNFGNASNALIDVGNLTNQAGNFSYAPQVPTSPITVFVRQANAGSASTVSLTVVDGCGPWQTFVGGGPNAWNGPAPNPPAPTASRAPGR